MNILLCLTIVILVSLQVGVRVVWWTVDEAAGRCQQLARLRGGLPRLPAHEETRLLTEQLPCQGPICIKKLIG